MPQNLKLSVVIPAYNEAGRIAQTLEESDRYLKKQNYDYEIIVVDNGSNDQTCEIVKEYQKTRVKHLVTLCFSKSIGAKGSAVRLGILEYAKGDYIMFMDADNATPVSEIEKFWPYFEQGFGVVIGSRYVASANVTERQAFYRIFLSRIGNLLTRLLVDPAIKDTQLGFKAFTYGAAKEIFKFVTIPSWGFDMEVLTIAKKHGFKIKEVGVLWRERGGSHVPLRGYLETLRDLLKIKLNSFAGKYDKSQPFDSAQG